MHFQPNSFYHIYNRGNNKQLIFFNQNNYIYFQRKIMETLTPLCDIIAYCLMPNHFHILVYIPETSEGTKTLNSQPQQILVRKLGTLLSSYCQAINKQEERTGSLFQQKTKSKELVDESYLRTCFYYIHQNPLKARLVNKLEDWQYSSFIHYLRQKSEIINTIKANEYIDIPLNKTQFYNESYSLLDQELIKEIF
jgi:REP element-mobilizing transposase RayT